MVSAISNSAGGAPRRERKIATHSFILTERRIALLILVVSSVVVGTSAFFLFGRYSGDALIYLPFAKNIAQGNVFAFNAGTFSSGSTSPLWPFILAPAFFLSGGEIATQCIAGAVLIVALADSYRTAFRLSNSHIGAAVALVVVAHVLVIPAMLMFESALLVLAMNALMRWSHQYCLDASSDNPHWVRLAMFWASLLWIRPDAVLIIGIHSVIVGNIEVRRRNMSALWGPAVVLGCSLIPIALYYLYSIHVDGVFSTSAYSRSFAFLEGAKILYGGHFSPVSLLFLLRPPMIIWCALAALGWRASRSVEGFVPLRMLTLFSAPIYLVMVSIIVPVTASPERYVVLMIPFVAMFCAVGARWIWNMITQPRWMDVRVSKGIIVIGVILSIAQLLLRAHREHEHGQTYASATDASLATILNERAPHGAAVLAYEVQVRLQLRPDLIVRSLDGVTDGAMVPYYSDITGYLKKYHPQYLVTNGAISRPYLANSVVGDVVRGTDAPSGSVVRDGVLFTLSNKNEEQERGGTWRRLYALEYSQRPEAPGSMLKQHP